MRRIVAALAALLVLVACDANPATTSPSSPPASPAESTNLPQAAVTALQTQHDAWQFTVTTYESGSPNFSRTIVGTQSQSSPSALSFTVTQSRKPDMRYVRIGTDVWFDTGTGAFTKSKASDNYVNMDFQPYFFESFVSAAETEGYEFQPVGADTVSGVATTHHRLADPDIQGIVMNMTDITPADWGADLWVSNADGSLLRLAWGPQSLDKAQDQAGFDYLVTSVDCDCSIEPPRAGGSQ
jgi:hypothetical protein